MPTSRSLTRTATSTMSTIGTGMPFRGTARNRIHMSIPTSHSRTPTRTIRTFITVTGTDSRSAHRVPKQQTVEHSAYAATLCVDYRLPVFFCEGTFLRQKKNVQDHLGRPTQFRAPRCYHDRPIDENGMCEHLVDQLRISPLIALKSQSLISCAFLAQQVTGTNAHPPNQRLECRAIRRIFQVFDNRGLNAGVADQRQCVAG